MDVYTECNAEIFALARVKLGYVARPRGGGRKEEEEEKDKGRGRAGRGVGSRTF